ncbi:MAG: hypothetical protein ABIT68_10590 [Sphingomicrobium sp.]
MTVMLICGLVCIPKLFGFLLALAVVFAPAVTSASAAYAAVPEHQLQMMAGGHCASDPSGNHDNSGTHDKSMSKNCCIAMCMALAVAPSAPATSKMPERIVLVFPAPSFRIGLPAEIATPPPRLA